MKKRGGAVDAHSGALAGRMSAGRRLSCALLGLYLLAVSVAHVVRWLDTTYSNSPWRMLAIFTAVAIALLCFFLPVLYRLLSSAGMASPAPVSKRQKLAWFAVPALISMTVLLTSYKVYTTYGFTYDPCNQYEQAASGVYNNWHPVWHTLIAFTLPLKLTGGGQSEILLFQFVCFSLAVGYAALTLRELDGTGGRYTAAVLIYLMLNPAVTNMVLSPLKDVTFALACCMTMCCAARTYFSDGAWCERRGRVFLLAFWLGNAAILRHNGVLFSATMLIALFFIVKRRRFVQLTLIALAFVGVVRGPVYMLLHVDQSGYRKGEIVGLPMTVIGNVVKETPELLDEETEAFAHAIAPQEIWEKEYICGSFNSVKFLSETRADVDIEVIEKTPVSDILRMTLGCVRASPLAAAKAFVRLTDLVYGMEKEDEQMYSVRPEETENYDWKLFALLENYRAMIKNSAVSFAFASIGFIHLVMVAFALCKSDLLSKASWKRLGLCLPVFAYSFGTMLLLQGNDARFFWFSYLVCPLVLLLMAREPDRQAETAMCGKESV